MCVSGSSIVSLDELLDLERSAEGDEGVLWCVSSDDPRCGPATPGHDAPRLDPLSARLTGGLHATDAIGPSPSTRTPRLAEAERTPSAGLPTQLDRPPRV